ncbi:hypothetical protein BT63DRAFT_438554 [Microthyrium microscopicum]|uniref:Uncharacterized protein n=1 Tax=Microthyrium microscopicum TaxID=703497 RepID=A0A6A6UH44_9PEZI|nr:hypothetical protein BT63DRAFT_438554 [Microthyrium microscopicum]
MSVAHSRNVSTDTTSSQTSAYQFILEHILSYPGTYGDVPLRSMYALNLQAMNRSLGSSASTSATTSPTTPAFPPQDETDVLKRSLQNCLVNQYSKSNPQKTKSLPPFFIIDFANRVFVATLHMVNFDQALTALDYLKDLEVRRHKELEHALKVIAIEPGTIGKEIDAQTLSKYVPEVANYLERLPKNIERADVLYTQLYVALRRWIMIYEMWLEPFNKASCHAMLNTLYPPAPASQVAPTSRLTVTMLNQQRNGFFNYIKAVEKGGKGCLQKLMMQGAKTGEQDGWSAVRRTLTNYLRLADTMIKDAQHIATLDVVSIIPEIAMEGEQSKRSSGKTDSGISFNGSEGRHSKNPSTSSSKSSFSNASHASFTSSSSAKSQGSTLERIARELKRMRPGRIQADEMINTKVVVMPRKLEYVPEISNSTPTSATSEGSFPRNYPSSTPITPITPINPTLPVPSLPTQQAPRSRFGALRKMKSLTALAELKHSNMSSSSLRAAEPFDAAAMKQRRQAFERSQTSNVGMF